MRKKELYSLEEWKTIKIHDISNIDKVIAIFEVWSHSKFPYGKVKIKILEKNWGGYIGLPNIAPKSKRDGEADWCSGLGNSVAEALEDTIKHLLRSIDEDGAIEEKDFIWAEPDDF
jgi:hypothetical protein